MSAPLVKQEETMLAAQHLFTLSLDIAVAHDLGAAPGGHKRFAGIGGGRFDGTRLRGTVCAGGTDWILVRNDDVRQVDVRVLLRTDDEAFISMRYEGYRLPSSMGVEPGASMDPHHYRIAAFFECADSRYAWLNQVVAIGLGVRHPPSGPVYQMHALR
jgi:hypothetical protein